MNDFHPSHDADAGSMPSLGRLEVAERTFFTRVFGWMGGGLLLTALVAWYFGSPERFASIFGGSRVLPFVLLLAQLGLVFAIGAAVRRLSETWAATLFVVYSALLGLTLSVLFLVYTTGSIVSTFLAAGGAFAASAVYGAVTKKDLTSFGSLMRMALIGLVIAMVVNMLLRSSALSWGISLIGVFVFVGLTAYDMQKLKDWHRSGIEGTSADRAMAVGGALTLYLDFINLFLLMLRFMGTRRD